MIVCLQRPPTGVGPWMMYGPPGSAIEFFDPTPELAAQVRTEQGYFEVETTPDGLRIIREVTKPDW